MAFQAKSCWKGIFDSHRNELLTFFCILNPMLCELECFPKKSNRTLARVKVTSVAGSIKLILAICTDHIRAFEITWRESNPWSLNNEAFSLSLCATIQQDHNLYLWAKKTWFALGFEPMPPGFIIVSSTLRQINFFTLYLWTLVSRWWWKFVETSRQHQKMAAFRVFILNAVKILSLNYAAKLWRSNNSCHQSGNLLDFSGWWKTNVCFISFRDSSLWVAISNLLKARSYRLRKLTLTG